MSSALATRGGGGVQRAPNPSGLADVLDLILDKGLVIDVYVRVSLVGIELLTIDARIVVASVDTYLRFAEAVNRLDLTQADDSQGLPELVEGMTESASKNKTKGALEGAKDKVSGFFDTDSDDEDEEPDRDEDERDEEEDERPRRRRRTASSSRRRSNGNGTRRRRRTEA